MNQLKRLLRVLNEMFYGRQQFITELRNDIFKGALGEFLCREIALAVGKPDNWSNEVGRLLIRIHKFMDKKEIVTMFEDRETALREAIKEASLSQVKVVYAKNKVSGYYPELSKQIGRLEYDSEVEFRKMIKEFLPSYLQYLE